MTVKIIESHQSFGGQQIKYNHFSKSLNCEMFFSLYLPQDAETTEIPLVWWLSGLTCTDDNFSQKGAFQKYANEQKLAIVMPDTSPRGKDIADSEDWDLGQGASFYVNATEKPWVNNFQMYAYLTKELPTIIYELIPNFSGKESIMGHSMGGHGALMIGLKNSNRFHSISAFAPISHPKATPWGQKAFKAYVGDNQNLWDAWDATELLKQTKTSVPILITQGDADNFYDIQLDETPFLKAARDFGHQVTYKKEKGYDHSYFTIASFIEEHLAFHAKNLNK